MTKREHATLAFIKGVFMDCGQPSFSRCASGLIVLASVGWVTFLVCKDGKMPDMAGITAYVSAALAVLYSANKVANAIEGTK